MASKWNHAICGVCWLSEGPRRAMGLRLPAPAPALAQDSASKPCCYCGNETTAGIFVRVAPAAMPCAGTRGIHADAPPGLVAKVLASTETNTWSPPPPARPPPTAGQCLSADADLGAVAWSIAARFLRQETNWCYLAEAEADRLCTHVEHPLAPCPVRLAISADIHALADALDQSPGPADFDLPGCVTGDMSCPYFDQGGCTGRNVLGGNVVHVLGDEPDADEAEETPVRPGAPCEGREDPGECSHLPDCRDPAPPPQDEENEGNALRDALQRLSTEADHG